ncbi:polysaccharide deacetylase family protein [Rhodopirellula bahusiensis]|uniref:DUF2334 domain-containing protein n=1 Tax=Rhodopirellula bahusiensis TaxID=2014065 RepID=A0A2G1W008_9BACT|nr:polysaccharide deacetylase family protein [Rhodopirellula bahusiensis]PHQ32009.1 DUF2334 domain-containing protein [Rhodopirellula bahusiensis]
MIALRESQRALFSIHDVMPGTMDDVGELLGLCRGHGVDKVTLLVVPGCKWQSADLRQLLTWQAMGCELAGHGWGHRCQSIRGLKHRLHSFLLSRDVAEHLSLDERGIVRLMSDCAQWFSCNGLGCPELYVPPAWAFGRVRHAMLTELPFSMIETLSGVRSIRQSRQQLLPLLGFEADTWARESALRSFNSLNRKAANLSKKPVRVAIHPQDHRLRLSQQLNETLGHPWKPVSYRQMMVDGTN